MPPYNPLWIGKDKQLKNMGPKTLGNTPRVDPSAVLVDTELGSWTEVGPRTQMTETQMGDYSYVMNDCDIIYTTIARFCSIASNVRINPGNHPLQRAALHHFSYRSRQFGLGEDDDRFFDWRRSHPVRIGNDVWIGHGAIILPGVCIGDGVAIGAGAVVTKDVPSFTIAAGVPAKPIRERFSKEIQEGLLRIRWWDWDRKRLADALADFQSMDAGDFVAKYDPRRMSGSD